MDGAGYRRTMRLPRGPATVLAAATLREAVRSRRTAAGPHTCCSVCDGRGGGATRTSSRPCASPIPRDLAPAVSRLRRLLDLDADPAAVDATLAADPVLAPSVAAVPGIRLPGTVDPAETALRAVLGQQVSVAAARTAATRLAAALGERLPPALAGDGPDLLFPTADDRRRARRGRA